MKIREMFDLMEKADLESAIIEFYGGGDEGRVEMPTLYAKEGCVLEESLQKITVEQVKELYQALERLVEYKQGDGWENGADSSGQITVCVKTRTVRSDYSIDEPVGYICELPVEPEYDLKTDPNYHF